MHQILTPGGVKCLYLSYEGLEAQEAELARLQHRYTDGLPPDLVELAYGLARVSLGGEDFPGELGSVDIRLYDQMCHTSGHVGGGIQFKINSRGRELNVRTQTYSIMGEVAVAMPDFDISEAVTTNQTARIMERACQKALLQISPDLTTIVGRVEVPQVVLAYPRINL